MHHLEWEGIELRQTSAEPIEHASGANGSLLAFFLSLNFVRSIQNWTEPFSSFGAQTTGSIGTQNVPISRIIFLPSFFVLFCFRRTWRFPNHCHENSFCKMFSNGKRLLSSLSCSQCRSIPPHRTFHFPTLSNSLYLYLSPIISAAFLYAKMDLRENLSTSAPSSVTYRRTALGAILKGCPHWQTE